MLGEFELIEKYFNRAPRRAALGVGDDCALIDVDLGMRLAVSSDMLVEGRHFLSTVAPERLGHKALAVNLSRPGGLRRRAAGLHAGAVAAARRRGLPRAAGARACSRWPTRTASS